MLHDVNHKALGRRLGIAGLGDFHGKESDSVLMVIHIAGASLCKRCGLFQSITLSVTNF